MSRLVTGASIAGLVAGPAHAASQPYFTWANAWRVDQHARELADVNGDGIEDFVGFGDGGTWVAYGRTNSTLAPATLKIRDFGVNQGRQVERHPRQLADVNDDGAADVVGFGDGGTWISYGRTDSTFTPPGLEVRDFGTAQGWRVDRHPRALAHVTGDGVETVLQTPREHTRGPSPTGRRRSRDNDPVSSIARTGPWPLR